MQIICTVNAEPMGTLINDGKHHPFRALACPLQPHMKQIRANKQKGASALNSFDCFETQALARKPNRPHAGNAE